MEDVTIRIDEVYVPAKHRRELDPATVESLAESILEIGLQTPISVRRDGERFVLVSGAHRLEACKALGEETITAIIVHAAQH
jgi:ParB-like chromosome segregation protein Spo0J